MRRRVLLPPQGDEQLRPGTAKEPGPRDFGMTCQAERDHPLRIVVPRPAMVHCHGTLATFKRGAAGDAAAVAISSQNLFTMAAEVFLILPSEGVAGRAKAESEDVITAARTADRSLEKTAHQLTSPIWSSPEELGHRPSSHGRKSTSHHHSEP